jgi:hypothetical protein
MSPSLCVLHVCEETNCLTEEEGSVGGCDSTKALKEYKREHHNDVASQQSFHPSAPSSLDNLA